MSNTLDMSHQHPASRTLWESVVGFVGRTSIIAAVMVGLGWLLGVVLPPEGVAEEPTGSIAHLVLPLLSAFLLASALAYPISRSRSSGKALFGAVFLAVFGLMTVLTLVEAALFLDMSTRALLIELIKNTLTSAVLAWMTSTLYPMVDHRTKVVERGPNPPSAASWVRRWIGVSLLYVVLYITAGLLILPLIRSWYEEQGTLEPDPAFFFPFQLARGALFVASVLPLLRSMRVTRPQASLAMAVMIPLVHGVASLIVPNPFMPDYVRWAHMLEIGWSNFVLGLVIGFLFWNPPRAAEESAESSSQPIDHHAGRSEVPA